MKFVTMESVLLQTVPKIDYLNLVDKVNKIYTLLEDQNSKNIKLSIKEVADELGVTNLTIHNYIKRGILPAFRIGRRVFIKRNDLNEALREVKSLKYKR